MPDVLIRNVPRKIVEALKRRAARRGRSLQQELRAGIERLSEQAEFDFVDYAQQMREELLRRNKDWGDAAKTIRRDRLR